MAKPKIPNQRKANIEHKKRVERYVALIQKAYDRVADEAARRASLAGIDPDKPFSFDDYPLTKKAIKELQAQLTGDVSAIIMTGTSDEWKESNLVQDLVAKKVLTAYTGTSKGGEQYTRYFETNPESLKAFQQRRDRGMNLSTRVWNLTEQYKAELEDSISAAIAPGTSAMRLAADVKKYLNEPDKRFRRVRDKYGKLQLSKNAEAYHPGQGVYRSSARNAQRLARTEINMAYRTAEQERWKQFDFVVGYEVKTTQNGKHETDICDSLSGKYPKTFKFMGWHPMCYVEDTDVLTDSGWKRFKDVSNNDLILSLNPDTRELEWVSIVARQCYDYNGDVVRFHNRSLDCVVTPEHRMVYLNKSNEEIRYCQAKDFSKGMGGFYRGAQYFGWDEAKFALEGKEVDMDDFCEFMGYYLSDGSLQHGTGVVIAQKKGEPAYDAIISVCERMGYSPNMAEDRICIYNSALNRYLQKFGVCYNKFIPLEIKYASKRQINIFLNAFIKCDGYSRKCKSFIGNRGNTFYSDKDERIYFTISQRLAGDLTELILKVGHRPSFSIQEPKETIKRDGSIIKGNVKCYRISELYSTTATEFSKECISYSGKVYDLTLERNHIMYIRRNGKCFWGSNCMCYAIPLLKTEDEFWNLNDNALSVNEVTDVPQGFKDWVSDNRDRIERAEERGKLPYFLRDNRAEMEKVLHPEKYPVKKTRQELAAERHADRTQDEIAEIQSRWNISREKALNSQLIELQSKISITYDGDIDIIFHGNELKGRSNKERLLKYLKALDTLSDGSQIFVPDQEWKMYHTSDRIKDGLNQDSYSGSDVKHLLSVIKAGVIDRVSKLPFISQLQELYRIKTFDISALPIEWRREYLNVIKGLSSGSSAIRNMVFATSPEANLVAYGINMIELGGNKLAQKFGLSNLSSKTPIQLFTDFEKAIPGYSDSLKSWRSKEFFDSLKYFIPLKTNLNKGCHYMPNGKFGYVHINPNHAETRIRLQSDFFKKSILSHEYGHGMFHQYDWINDADIKDIYDKWVRAVNMDGGKALMDKIGAKLKSIPTSGYGYGFDIYEQLGKMSDSAQAAIKRHPFLKPMGHKEGVNGYFKEYDAQLNEIIAHTSENLWIGNPIFKEIAPGFYKKMRELIAKKLGIKP